MPNQVSGPSPVVGPTGVSYHPTIGGTLSHLCELCGPFACLEKGPKKEGPYVFERIAEVQSDKDTGWFRRYFVDNFDARMGAMGGLLVGSGVFYAKYADGMVLAAYAASEQFLFNFLLGGAMMKLCERLAVRYVSRRVSIWAGILVPGFLNITGTYVMHCFDDGLVNPIRSTIPSMIFAPMGYIWWANRKRKQLEQ